MRRFQNENVSPVRISIEHSHAFDGMKVGLTSGGTRLQALAMPVQSFTTVTQLLCNAHVALLGSQVSMMFRIPPPSLEQHFGTARCDLPPAACA